MDDRDWDARYEKVDSVWSLTPNEFVVEFLAELPVGSLIDLAGGEGRNALWFATRGWHVENADFSAVALAKFERRAAEEGVSALCTATRSDATSIPVFALAPADVGLIAYLQIDSLGLRSAIASLAANLKSGGVLLGVWHARENLRDGFGGPQDPLVLPTQEELRTAFEAAGLPSPRIELRKRTVQDGAGVRDAIDVLAFAIKP